MFVEEKVANVSTVSSMGIYTPLTSVGNLVAEDILVSCHALLHNQVLHRDYYTVGSLRFSNIFLINLFLEDSADAGD